MQFDPMRDLGRVLLATGLVVAALGLLLTFGSKLPFRIGRLPGDIVFKRDHFTFYMPIVTSLLLSLVLSLLYWLLRRRS